MTKKELKRKVHEIIKKDFKSLRNPFIFFVSRDDIFMACQKIPFFFVLLVDEETFKMNDKAITGCIVHELCHMEHWDYLERIIDQMVIHKGYGEHLYEFLKYHDSIYKKYNKKDGLTKNEVWKQIRRSTPH